MPSPRTTVSQRSTVVLGDNNKLTNIEIKKVENKDTTDKPDKPPKRIAVKKSQPQLVEAI